MMSWLTRWLSENSLYRHLAFAPLGSISVTWILLGFSDIGWNWWSGTGPVQAGQVVPLGTVVYGTLAVFADGVFKMIFFALAQRKNEIAKRHLEGRRQLLQELINKGIDLPPDLLQEAEELGLLQPETAGRA